MWRKRLLGFAHRFRPTYPDFLHGAPPTPACAAFIRESPHEVRQRQQGRQEIRSPLGRTWGTRLSSQHGVTDIWKS
jgi:hypothetical protein